MPRTALYCSTQVDEATGRPEPYGVFGELGVTAWLGQRMGLGAGPGACVPLFV